MTNSNEAISKKSENNIVKLKGVEFIKSVSGIDEYKLNNGLKVILKPNPNASSFSWQVWYKVGSRNESPSYTGIAHYLEHIMFKGTNTFMKGEIAQSIQLKGGIFNAFTGDDYTAYYENFSPENLELAIKIEADRMQNSRLNPDEINLERSVIVSELEGNKNNPHSILYENLRVNSFKVHTYRNPVIGWREDLDNIDAKIMREFYETYYYPNNAVAILVGNFDKELALELINKYFSQYKPKTKDLPKVPVEPVQDKEKKIVIRNGGHNKILGIAFHIPEFTHEDSPALGVLSDILYSGMSSRLYPKLVDEGLVTGLSAVSESSIDPSLFRIIVTLNPSADIQQVEKIILAELEDLKSNVSEDELKIAKAKEEASFVYQLDGPHEEALQIGYFEAITSDWTRYTSWLSDIKNVSADDVKNVAKKYFTINNKTVVHILPELPSETLVNKEEDSQLEDDLAVLSISSSKQLSEANYGAGTVEPLSPKKLDRLLKLTAPKFSKNHKFSKIDLDFEVIEDGVGSLYFRQDSNLPLVFLNAYFHAGSINDGEKYGLAKLTNDMLGRGSKSKDKYEISKLTDLYGADVSFSTGREMTRVHLSTISKNLSAVVEILNEILQEPAFSEVELERLKANTIARLKQEEDYPQKIAAREIARIIYPDNHPYYVLSVEDRMKAIESISIEEIRAFYKKYYNSNTLHVSIVGDIEKQKAISIKEQLFANWNNHELDLANNVKPLIPNVPIKEPVEKLFNKPDKTQTEIILAHSGEISRTHPDYYPLLLANYALGGSALSSRLGTSVRDESGFVYNIRSSFEATLGAGAFKVILGCNPKNVEAAINLTKKVIKEFLEEGISQTELDVTKSYFTGSFSVRTLASNQDITETLSQMQVYELGPDYIKTYEDRINSISLEQVREAARKYLQPDKLSTVIVGPGL
jgi:zinc protease